MTEDEDMRRWRDFAKERRTAVNAHFLTYAVGILVFQSSILISSDVVQIKWPCIYIVGAIMALLSFSLGSGTILIRLHEARLKARTLRFEGENKDEDVVDDIKSKAESSGEWTNRLIVWQVITFIISAMLFIIWVSGAYWYKLSG